jgi:Antitoxin Phd_YefM, type II toxin-antitoxin system
MAGSIRKPRVREIPLSEVKDDLSHLLREAAKGDIVITRHGKPAGTRGGVRGDAGIRSALRALSPHPAALRHSRRSASAFFA